MPDLNDLRDYRRGAEWAVAAGVSLELGIIAALGDGPAGAREIAHELDLSVRGVETLLGSLEELGAVTLDDEGWRLTGAARARLLDRETPDFEADNLLHWLRSIRRWSQDLPEAVRTGSPGQANTPACGPKRGKDLETFMAAMANRSPDDVAAVADAVRAAAPGAGSLLDIGGGPGVYCPGIGRPRVHGESSGPAGSDRIRRPRRTDSASDERIHLVSADFLHELPDRDIRCRAARQRDSHIRSSDQP